MSWNAYLMKCLLIHFTPSPNCVKISKHLLFVDLTGADDHVGFSPQAIVCLWCRVRIHGFLSCVFVCSRTSPLALGRIGGAGRRLGAIDVCWNAILGC